MSEKKAVPLLQALRKYYNSSFSLEPYEKAVVTQPYGNREFGFLLPDNVFIRNRSFHSKEALLEYFQVNVPLSAYAGAVYDQPLSPSLRIQDAEWMGHELVFDLDINEYDPVRICGCKGREYCHQCWGLIQEAAEIIDETLKDDFGYKERIWVFTGGRGLHCWVKDKKTFLYSPRQRDAVVGYMQMIHDPKGQQRVDSIPSAPKLLVSRIYSKTLISFLTQTSEKVIEKATGISKQRVKRLVKEAREYQENVRLGTPLGNWLKKGEEEKVLKAAVLYRYPRIDHKVSIDIRRVLRMPGTVHSSTGLISEIITNPTEFYPDEAMSVWEAIE